MLNYNDVYVCMYVCMCVYVQLKWCRHKPATGWEGGRVTSNPFLDCQLAAAKHIPTITQQSR